MVEFDEELYPQTVATPESIAIADEGRERLSRALERSETLCIDCVSPISGGCADGTTGPFACSERNELGENSSLHRLGSEEKALAIHPSVQQIAPYREVEIC